ncbi:hypothetical protein [Aureimonas sp. AU40]|uniref:hypothetical protein n=1 Tax=Aureimonas sp. AU40 TaxID=1637747 RepID=UPI0007852FD4|nr:hypothetical protein [Aureimonas sp. AU40]
MSPLADTPSLTRAARDVLAERRRQIEAEGYTPEHDDTHRLGELARAGAAYAVCTGLRRVGDLDRAMSLWPFEPESFKHQDDRASLVAAGALILAEIERLDRISKNRSMPYE